MNERRTVEKRIYLDHNATTPVHSQVLEAMLPCLKENFGNASSIHAEGRAARAVIDRARAKVAALLGASTEEIYFTSGGSESNNLALRGTVELHEDRKGRIVTSAVEHDSILKPSARLAGLGYEVVTLPVDSYGRVVPDDLRKCLAGGKALLVSIIAANNEVGTLQPVEELGRVCREFSVLFHVDAVQAVGRIGLDLKTLPVDLLSLSAHKIYGPKGTGVLYMRKGVRLAPQILGGSHERRLRAGTENTAGIAGLGAACELARAELEQRKDQPAGLRERLWTGLRNNLEGLHLNGHPVHRLSNTLNVSFEGVEGEALLLNLDLRGIACSSGSACASGSLEASHVLTAMGVPPELAQASVRFSLGRDNTAEEIDRVIEEVSRVVVRLRSMQFSH